MTRHLSVLFIFAIIMTTNSTSQSFPLPPTVAEGATLEVIHTGEVLYEGPVWDDATQSLLFTSCRAEVIFKLDVTGNVTPWMTGNGGANGMVRGADGRILAAVVMAHRLDSIGATPDDVRTLAENASWNQPNDVCQSPNGDIYFSDPSWGDHSQSAVYHLSPDGTVEKVIDDLKTPNGVITSLDGQWLIVGDSVDAIWWRYPILEDGSVGERELFFDPPTENRLDPDGMTIDEHGNFYLTGRGGVWVASPDGEPLGLIPTPQFCSNVTIGGPDGHTLYMTGRNTVWRLALNVGIGIR